jgi:putative peptidoglycan lipid II flippase
MVKKSIFVSAIFILSTFIQLISQIVVTRLFGAQLELEIFLAAVAIPTIVVTVIYGTLNDVFLPRYSQYKHQHPELADNYFSFHLLVLSIVSFIFSLLLGFLSLPLSRLFYAGRGELFVQMTASQMAYMFYAFPLSVMAAILGAYFYSHKKFQRFPTAQAVGSLANLLIIILLAKSLGTRALPIAFVWNILIQIFFVIPKLNLKNFKFQTRFARQVSNFKLGNLILAWLPLIIGNLALRSDTLLVRSFGSQLPTGNLVYLNLITKIFSLATGVMTIGLQIVLLPHLVDYLMEHKYQLAFKNVRQAKLGAIGISILVTSAIYFLSPFFIKLLFIGGKFTAYDAQQTISLLPFFILPAIGWGINGVFSQPLLALKKTYHLGLINVLALVIAWAAAFFSQKYFGVLTGISVGLTVLFAFIVAGDEILWQYFKKKELSV